MPVGIKHALIETYEDVARNHTLQMAAALSYYFVVSFFPALILLSAIVAYLPVPDLFNQALSVMTQLLPPDSMGAGPESFVGCNHSQQRNVPFSWSLGNALDVFGRILGCN